MGSNWRTLKRYAFAITISHIRSLLGNVDHLKNRALLVIDVRVSGVEFVLAHAVVARRLTLVVGAQQRLKTEPRKSTVANRPWSLLDWYSSYQPTLHRLRNLHKAQTCKEYRSSKIAGFLYTRCTRASHTVPVGLAEIAEMAARQGPTLTSSPIVTGGRYGTRQRFGGD